MKMCSTCPKEYLCPQVEYWALLLAWYSQSSPVSLLWLAINISPVSSATLKSFLFVSLHFFITLWVSLLSVASRSENVNDSGNSSCCAGMHLQKRWSWLSYWHSSVYLTCQCFGQFFCYTGLFYLSWQWSARFGTWSNTDTSPSLWASRYAVFYLPGQAKIFKRLSNFLNIFVMYSWSWFMKYECKDHVSILVIGSAANQPAVFIKLSILHLVW